MTNLEKWKSELTPQKLSEMFSSIADSGECSAGCPAYPDCSNDDKGYTCGEFLTVWAESEVD